MCKIQTVAHRGQLQLKTLSRFREVLQILANSQYGMLGAIEDAGVKEVGVVKDLVLKLQCIAMLDALTNRALKN